MILTLVLLAVLGEDSFYRATALDRDGHPDQAADVYRSITEGPFADDALLELGRLLEEKLGDPVAAATTYERLAHEHPESRLAGRARRRAETLRQALGPDGRAAPAVAELNAILLGSAGEPREELVTRMEKLLAAWPDFPDAPRALVWMGNTLADLGRRDEALARYEAARTRFPTSEWAPRAARAEADLRLVLGDLGGAERLYATLPDADARESGLGRVAAARGRARWELLAWLVLGTSAVAAVVATRRAAGSFRTLLRPPIEVIFLLPFALLFIAAASSENVSMTRAVVGVCGGGLVCAWLSGVSLQAARPARGTRVMVTALLAASSIAAICYISIVRAGLHDFLVETLRFGPER